MILYDDVHDNDDEQILNFIHRVETNDIKFIKEEMKNVNVVFSGRILKKYFEKNPNYCYPEKTTINDKDKIPLIFLASTGDMINLLVEKGFTINCSIIDACNKVSHSLIKFALNYKSYDIIKSIIHYKPILPENHILLHTLIYNKLLSENEKIEFVPYFIVNTSYNYTRFLGIVTNIIYSGNNKLLRKIAPYMDSVYKKYKCIKELKLMTLAIPRAAISSYLSARVNNETDDNINKYTDIINQLFDLDICIFDNNFTYFVNTDTIVLERLKTEVMTLKWSHIFASCLEESGLSFPGYEVMESFAKRMEI